MMISKSGSSATQQNPGVLKCIIVGSYLELDHTCWIITIFTADKSTAQSGVCFKQPKACCSKGIRINRTFTDGKFLKLQQHSVLRIFGPRPEGVLVGVETL